MAQPVRAALSHQQPEALVDLAVRQDLVLMPDSASGREDSRSPDETHCFWSPPLQSRFLPPAFERTTTEFYVVQDVKTKRALLFEAAGYHYGVFIGNLGNGTIGWLVPQV
jgi:hypothetical protein